jgi:hypothetical protein
MLAAPNCPVLNPWAKLYMQGETGSTPNPVNGRLLQLDTMAELAKD